MNEWFTIPCHQSYLGYWSQNIQDSLQKQNSLCAQSSHVWGDPRHGCSSGMMSRTNNCKPSMLQSQLLAKAHDNRLYCHFTFVYWGRISSPKSMEYFLCEASSNWKTKVMIERKDEYQLLFFIDISFLKRSVIQITASKCDVLISKHS